MATLDGHNLAISSLNHTNKLRKKSTAQISNSKVVNKTIRIAVLPSKIIFKQYLLRIAVNMTKLHLPLQVMSSLVPLRSEFFTVSTPLRKYLYSINHHNQKIRARNLKNVSKHKIGYVQNFM